MKRWVLYFGTFLIISSLGISPFCGTDIARLSPVEMVWLSSQGGEVYLQTDAGDLGQGENVQAALEQMHRTSPGTIFLETADYLIVQQGKEYLIEQVYGIFRPSCLVFAAPQIPEGEDLSDFLKSHERGIPLRQLRNEQRQLPLLTEHEGRFEWLES